MVLCAGNIATDQTSTNNLANIVAGMSSMVDFFVCFFCLSTTNFLFTANINIFFNLHGLPLLRKEVVSSF